MPVKKVIKLISEAKDSISTIVQEWRVAAASMRQQFSIRPVGEAVGYGSQRICQCYCAPTKIEMVNTVLVGILLSDQTETVHVERLAAVRGGAHQKLT